MSKWVQFTRGFNYVPPKKAAVTIQHSAGDVDDVTDHHAAKAIAKGAAVEVNPPANREEAEGFRNGSIKPTPKVEEPAPAPVDPSAGGEGGQGGDDASSTETTSETTASGGRRSRAPATGA